MSTRDDAGALAGAVAAVLPVGLGDLTEQADLQTRVDHKYVVPLDDLATLVETLRPALRVLEIGGRRVFGYRSTYFDTRCHRMYREHVQGRRHRHKVRVREYLDSGLTMLEVKAKGGRGETVKHRRPWDASRTGDLGPEGRAFVDGFLSGRPAAAELGPVLVSGYHRATLADLDGGLRITCDVDLTFDARPTLAGLDVTPDGALDRGQVRVPAGTALVETKSASGRSVADHLLHRLGHRDIAVSKYCAGLAMTAGLPANRWQRTIRRHLQPAPGG